MIDERSIPRRLWDLALPVMGLNVLNVLALAVDTAMCGRLPDAEAALTGLGFASQIVFLLLVGMMGLVVGCVALVSRAHGAGDDSRVEHILLQSSQLTVLLSVGVGVLGNLGARPMLSALGAEGPALEAGVDYLRPLLAGTVFYYLSLLFAAVLRGVGDTRLAFLVALGSNLVNVVANYGLILGNYGLPALGVRGAAIGTVLSHFTAVVALVVLLRRGAVPAVRVALRPRPLDLPLARELFRVGAPAALDLVVLQAGFLAIIGMLGRIDQAAVAAHGIGLRIQALAFVPGLGVSQANAAMVGQALGAGDPGEARRVSRAAMAISAAVMTTLAVPIVIGAAPIVGVFDVAPGTPLESYSIQWIRLLGSGMPIVGVHIALVGTLRGSGATNTSLLINVLATVVQIPLSFALGFAIGWGPFGVWLAFPLSFALRAVLSLGAYRHGAWARVGSSVSRAARAPLGSRRR